MIVQTAAGNEPRFVIRMADHMALAARMARAFGNENFEPVGPGEEAHYAIANHDAGWADLDSRFPIDPETGFPYDLAETPFELISETSRGSPDFNERHHPFSGLISSMHSWGLYNGRYGLSDVVLLDRVAERNLEEARSMLDRELERQERLKRALQENSRTAPWVSEPALMKTYKQLQFFDTLALYFNRIHEGAREAAVFPHVPKSETEDADVTVTPLGDAVYAVAPYPFSRDPLTLEFEGRYMRRGQVRTAGDAALLPADSQSVTLRSAWPAGDASPCGGEE